MTRSRLLASTLLLAAPAIACTTNDAGNDTDAITSTSTGNASNPSGSQSGSATSAPGSATDGTVSDSTPTMATATTTTSGTSDGNSTTGEPCLFLNCDDMMNVMSECDSWAQDCPEGQKCTPYIAGGGGSWDAVKCVDVTGTGKPGELCTSEGAASGIDSCVGGVMCWGVDMEGVGTCVAMCTGSPEAGICENGYCTIAGDGILHLCLKDCDPLLQDCPKPAEVCYPIADGFTCAPDASGDEGQANDPCELINGCDKGLMCAEAALVGAGCMPGAALGCCTPFCKFPDGPCPNPDQQCVQYFDPRWFPENDPQLDIGACGVPG
jgi:hypothetical protein